MQKRYTGIKCIDIAKGDGCDWRGCCMSGNLGFDLGTTNSTVCYYDYERNGFDYLRFDENSLDYFPSMLTYRPNEDLPLVGFTARKRMHLKGSHFFLGREIKLNIGKNSVVRDRNVKDLLRDQIGIIIGKYVDQKKEIPDHIVLTVPAKWTESDCDGTEMDMLGEVFAELGFDIDSQIQFVSEPVAAAAFFARGVLNNTFQGRFMILDYGGGTLDATICQIDQGNTIRVLYKAGKTGAEAIGCAGEAFDIELCKLMVRENEIDVPFDENGKIDTSSKAFLKLQRCLEEGKIALSSATTAALRKYYLMPEKEKQRYLKEPAFDVCTPDDDVYIITVGAVIDTFEEVNRPTLKRVILDALDYCKDQAIDFSDENHFRIILTGGFSNLYCVDATIYELFDVSYDNEDLRFSQMIDRNIRSTAIAHGAAIIAEGWIIPELVCSENIGFFYYDPIFENRQNTIFVKKNDSVSKYRNPVFLDRIMESDWMDESPVLEIFTDSRPCISVPISELCPDAGKKGVKYQLGLSILNGVKMLHSKDQDGVLRTKSLEFSL